MALSTYTFSVDASGFVYTFISKGFRTLTKKVIFAAINPYFYNVVLCTEEDSELLPDTENSNNGDVFSVLWTCAEIIRHFMKLTFGKVVYISGSENRRQRSYQRMLSAAIKEGDALQVFGQLPDGTVEPFRNDRMYIACLVFH